MEGKKLWDLVKNTDFEESIHGRLNMDDVTDDEMITRLDNMTKEWVIEEHCLWHGYGIGISDIKWMLDILVIRSEDDWDEL